MKTTLRLSLGEDILNVILARSDEVNDMQETAIDEIDGISVTKVEDVDTGDVVGWIFYDFTRKFNDGSLREGTELPPTDLMFELEEAPGQSFDIRELLQWAYDNLVKAPATS